MVVVGSGAGGGTLAARLVKAGLRVIIIEKGPYHSSHRYSVTISHSILIKISLFVSFLSYHFFPAALAPEDLTATTLPTSLVGGQRVRPLCRASRGGACVPPRTETSLCSQAHAWAVAPLVGYFILSILPSKYYCIILKKYRK